MTLEIPTVTMFCLAMRRDVYEQVGPLDTQFEVGTLEDDDYSMRVHEAGYRTICADDAFVHHFGEASFGKLVPTGEYAKVLERNKAKFEQKWGVPWQSYGRRRSASYEGLTERIRQIVADNLPARRDGARGEPRRRRARQLRRPARHATSPPRRTGAGQATTRPTRRRRSRFWRQPASEGGKFLLVPETGFWWLDYYDGFGQHLRRTATRPSCATRTPA